MSSHYAIVAIRGLFGRAFSAGLDAIVEPFKGEAYNYEYVGRHTGYSALAALKDFEGTIIVLCHSLGWHAAYEQIPKYLAGKNVWLVSLDPAEVDFDGRAPLKSPLGDPQRHLNIWQQNDIPQDFGPVSGAQNIAWKERGHSQLDDRPGVQKRVRQFIATALGEHKENPMPQIALPTQVEALHDELDIILQPERETAARTRFYEAFFGAVREPVFGGGLSQPQIDGLKRLLFLWQRFFSHHPIGWLAFILANIGHETGYRFEPVRETFAATDDQAMTRLENAWNRGELLHVSRPYWRNGEFGRGDIQVTHKSNRFNLDEVFDKIFGWVPGFGKNRDLLLDPVLSGLAAMVGCIEGTFRAHKLAKYDFPEDFQKARAIVNGDAETRAGRVTARHAQTFLKALQTGLKHADEIAGEVEAPPEVIEGEIIKPGSLENWADQQLWEMAQAAIQELRRRSKPAQPSKPVAQALPSQPKKAKESDMNFLEKLPFNGNKTNIGIIAWAVVSIAAQQYGLAVPDWIYTIIFAWTGVGVGHKLDKMG